MIWKGKFLLKKIARQSILIRDGEKCFYCALSMDDNTRTIEHLVPLAKGGTDTINNLVMAHDRCNRHYGSLRLDEKLVLREYNLKGKKKLRPMGWKAVLIGWLSK